MNKSKYYVDKKLPFLELRYSNTNNCYKEHFHETFSIGAIIQGEREYTNINESFVLKPNQLALVNPNTIHSCNSNMSNEIYMLYLDKKWCYKIQKDIFSNIDEFIMIETKLINDNKKYNKFIALCKILFSNAFYIQKESLLIDFISELYLDLLKVNINNRDHSNNKIELIIDYLKININENLTLEDISKEFNLSTYYLTRLFKKRLNISLHSFFINLKIEKSKELLKKTENISSVALELGFFDQSHFHRNFKKIVAITPKDYLDNFVQ